MKRLSFIILFICKLSFAGTDMFGGWDVLQTTTSYTVNRNADGSATATSVAATVLTDTAQSWTADYYIGCILQPDVSEDMYFLITDNDATTVTVLDSDRTGGDYTDLTDYNDGTDEYRILSNWKTEKIGNKWWIIDPMDNVFIMKAVANFYAGTSNNSPGLDRYGNNLITNIRTKYGSGGQLERHRIASIKSWGFNTIGTGSNYSLLPGVDSGITSIMYMPHFLVQRPQIYWTLANTGFLDGSEDYWDVFDPDFISEFESEGEGMGDGATAQESYDIVPYKAKKYRRAANPYFAGIKTSHELSNFGSHWGYWFLVLAPDYVKTDGVNDTKAAYVNYLRALYTVGGEAAFVTNISPEGSDEITIPASWSGVTGYVDAQHDTDALTALNAAWETSYANWTQVYYEDRSDPNDTKTGSSDITFADADPDTITISGDTWSFAPEPNYITVTNSSNNNGTYRVASYSTTVFTLEASETLTGEANTSATLDTVGEIYRKVLNIYDGPCASRTTGPASSDPAQVLLDLDELGEAYWRRWNRTIYNEQKQDMFYGWKLFTPMAVKVPSATVGGRVAIWRGSVSADGDTKYFDMIPIGSPSGSRGSWDGSEQKTTATELTAQGILSAEIDIPIYNNSSWTTCEYDSDRGTRGIVDEIQYTILIEGVTDSSGNTGTTVVDADTITGRDRVVDFGDSLGENCEDSADNDDRVVFYNVDSGTSSKLASVTSNTEIELADEGVTANDMNYEIWSYNILYDASADFDGPNDTDTLLSAIAASEKYLCNADRFQTTQANMFIRVNRSIDDTHITLSGTTYGHGGIYGANRKNVYGARGCDLRDFLEPGEGYGIAVLDWKYGALDGVGGWIPKTQEERAKYWTEIWEDWFDLEDSNGVKCFVGFGWWSIWDYGAGWTESRNFGLMSATDNAYDGSEATTLGADGVADTWDDEHDNYGDAVTRVSRFLNGLYRSVGFQDKASDIQASGVVFR